MANPMRSPTATPGTRNHSGEVFDPPVAGVVVGGGLGVVGGPTVVGRPTVVGGPTVVGTPPGVEVVFPLGGVACP
jgi:hypothetical protein